MVVRWQSKHGRQHLPWQRTRDPYRVWLSEIMLQQTQVQTVLPYYDAFLQRFPDVRHLAAAPVDDVLAAWSGLGYYSRARNLHQCACLVVETHDGVFPVSAAALQTLPGIGRSTAAAIAAFCHGERVAILDGNVKRVLGRVLAYPHDLARAAAVDALWRVASEALPGDAAQMPAYTQGLMDLGATVCKLKAPRCDACPLAASCAAHRSDAVSDFPVKSSSVVRRTRENLWLCLVDGPRLWFEQRPARGVWGGLWSWPLVEDEARLRQLVASLRPRREETLPTVTHALTHFDWVLHPVRLEVDPASVSAEPRLAEGRWLTPDEALQLGLPAPLRRLLTTP